MQLYSLPEILTSPVLSPPVLKSVCVLTVTTATGGNATDSRFIHYLRSVRHSTT